MLAPYTHQDGRYGKGSFTLPKLTYMGVHLGQAGNVRSVFEFRKTQLEDKKAIHHYQIFQPLGWL